jgi:hypothetical protein
VRYQDAPARGARAIHRSAPARAGGDDEDVVFFWRGERPPVRDRTGEDIMLRRVPAETAKRFRQAAGGRSMTHAQYLTALVVLHDAMRGLADAGADERVAKALERLGLSTVTV